MIDNHTKSLSILYYNKVWPILQSVSLLLREIAFLGFICLLFYNRIYEHFLRLLWLSRPIESRVI